jgi:hypothetical protein
MDRQLEIGIAPGLVESRRKGFAIGVFALEKTKIASAGATSSMFEISWHRSGNHRAVICSRIVGS